MSLEVDTEILEPTITRNVERVETALIKFDLLLTVLP
jgi:hypothetical protein